MPDYNYLRNLLKRVIKKNGDTIDFFYDWCSQKPNIKSDDIIYTNDYKIQYNGPNEWLNNFEPYKKSINENENSDDDDDNEDKNKENNNNKKNHNFTGINKSNLSHSHNRVESNNLSTKCIDSDSKKYLPFKSLKK